MQAIYTIFEQGNLKALTFHSEELPPNEFEYEQRRFVRIEDNTWATWQNWKGFSPAMPVLKTLKADLVTETKTPEVLVYQVEIMLEK